MKKIMVMLMVELFFCLINVSAQKINTDNNLIDKKQLKDSNLNGRFITLTDSNGLSFRAYTAGPKDAKGGILLIHDYFGITDASKKSVEQLAGLGYETIAVDLYNGKSATTNDSAKLLMNAKDSSETANILRAAIHYLERPGRKLAAIGFSAGGIDAMNATLMEPDLFKAIIIIYGATMIKLKNQKSKNSKVLY